MDQIDAFLMSRPPTSTLPLLGLTILLVEDSRFASETIRLLAQKSGARLRRADTLAHARRHLALYRPSVVIVDLGLPDGSGLDLIRELAQARPRVLVLLGTSGDPDLARASLAAGADGFFEKPLKRIANFQEVVLRHLPPERQFREPREIDITPVRPDRLAWQDDLAHADAALADAAGISYAAQFLASIARDAGDADLARAASHLSDALVAGPAEPAQVRLLRSLIRDRLDRQTS